MNQLALSEIILSLIAGGFVAFLIELVANFFGKSAWAKYPDHESADLCKKLTVDDCKPYSFCGEVNVCFGLEPSDHAGCVCGVWGCYRIQSGLASDPTITFGRHPIDTPIGTLRISSMQ